MSRIKEFLSLALHAFLSYAFSGLSVKRGSVVFCNYGGRGYGDSPAAIANEILRRHLRCQMIWLVRDLGCEVPDGIKKVKRGWLFERACLARAQFIVSNTKGDLDFRRKKNRYYIQTWHGDMPFKQIEAECESMLSPYYVRMSKEDSTKTDFVLSGSSFFSKIAQTSFWLPSTCEVLECGIPRNDVFFTASEDEKVAFKQSVFGKSEVKVALYAPTFRDAIGNDVCRFDVERLRRSLSNKFGGTWIVVIRLHPNVAGSEGMFNYGDYIVNGTRIENGQKLSLVSDVLITDYSSIVEEFIIQRKPVFIYAPDLDEYVEKERRLRDLYFRLPFERCQTEIGLFDAVDRFDGFVYQEKLADFCKRDCRIFDDGHASERVVDLIEKLMG